MNPKKSPSSTFRQGDALVHKTSIKMREQGGQWIWESANVVARGLKNIFFFLCISLMIPFSSHSQTNKESLPIFILQGTVKLKGKPVEGVSLELLKNEKQISQILTRKNGMYSFQMNTSNTDTEAVYILKIKKEGAAPGILKINTYTVNEGSNFVPYIFNLEVNLTQPVASNVMAKQDFGKIKWDSQRSVFDFDKEYVSIVEKDADSIKTDSSRYPLAVIDKINKMAEKIKTAADEQTKQKADDLKNQQLKNENLAKVSKIKETEKKDGNIGVNEKKEITSDKQKLALGNKKSEQSKAKIETVDPKAARSNINTAAGALKKKTKEIAELKTKENTKKLSNLKGSKEDIKNKKEQEAIEIAELKTKENTNKFSNLKESKEEIENKKEQEAIKIKLENQAKQLATDNKQQSANPTSVDINPSTFDGVSLFITNNQKNKLLENKNKMERKKTENLTKKYETSNILTSLLDVVEAFDEK
ncbi:MAG: hypothetical protein V4511_15855 [Bacteroidota bacterium]